MEGVTVSVFKHTFGNCHSLSLSFLLSLLVPPPLFLSCLPGAVCHLVLLIHQETTVCWPTLVKLQLLTTNSLMQFMTWQDSHASSYALLSACVVEAGIYVAVGKAIRLPDYEDSGLKRLRHGPA